MQDLWWLAIRTVVENVVGRSAFWQRLHVLDIDAICEPLLFALVPGPKCISGHSLKVELVALYSE